MLPVCSATCARLAVGSRRPRRSAYLNTAAVGLASHTLVEALRSYVDEWPGPASTTCVGRKPARSPAAPVAALIGASPTDVALIPSVSASAGLVAAESDRPGPDKHRDRRARVQLESLPVAPPRGEGLRRPSGPVPQRWPRARGCRGAVDGATVLVAFSGVQTATGHRSDIRAISAIRVAVGAIVFVDGSQLVGALPVAEDLEAIDVLATADHKFLLHAGRGLGYCYLSRATQERFVPVGAGWKAGRIPLESFFGPDMDLSPTVSRFDSSISWLAAIGNEAALSVFDQVRRAAPSTSGTASSPTQLRASLTDIGWTPPSPRGEPQHRSCRCRCDDAEPVPGGRTRSAIVALSARRATASCGSRSTSTITRTTSSGSPGRSPSSDQVRPRTILDGEHCRLDLGRVDVRVPYFTTMTELPFSRMRC